MLRTGDQKETKTGRKNIVFGENVQVDGGEHTKSLGKELAEKEKNILRNQLPRMIFAKTLADIQNEECPVDSQGVSTPREFAERHRTP